MPTRMRTPVSVRADHLNLEASPMNRNLAQKLIASHLVEGDMVPGSEIGIQRSIKR